MINIEEPMSTYRQKNPSPFEHNLPFLSNYDEYLIIELKRDKLNYALRIFARFDEE
ncbi:uncharacterized protein PHALS_03957 [Plasmopara halstedii]|uniref:Uncharacterized protein n=1 Tax=Plasmopara halstedii TaxID=4781 RepID=A0A0P1B1Q9_PLAHL|nr:uncharacterized protein PHALS_03957 [Plasmopara halstedii]CEG47302.1 hypothetical protein PHALS_03957 [Plasmopara halstedii]|eukprot:XP_024583671.1 hypothetical protein PHALS_03957 [Plasmopara halstedii]